MIYNNPITVVVGLIPIRAQGKIVLLGIIRNKRTDDGYGLPALIGGYVNAGESLETAIAREAAEEISFKSRAEDWSLWYSRHVASSNLNLVFCRHPLVLSVTNLTPSSEEVKSVIYVTETTQLAFPLHEEAVNAFLRRITDVPA